MLLFIIVRTIEKDRVCGFKYISCYCLSDLDNISSFGRKDSNTSHVIVYLCIPAEVKTLSDIQIHLMLLFIRIRGLCFGKRIRIQIHLMLLFIWLFPGASRAPGMIQIHLMLLFIPAARSLQRYGKEFKYISCYCLSQCRIHHRRGFRIQIHLMLLFIRLDYPEYQVDHQFKYISCYCLSNVRKYDCYSTGHSNTSHVIVYQRNLAKETLEQYNSNTSHVIVYRRFARNASWRSCYSNTSHVIVYLNPYQQQIVQNRYSNTSHVIVYRKKGFLTHHLSQTFKYISCYCLSWR